MVSSCGSARQCPVTVLICPISQLLTASWEFLTTLHYEWSIIRGHRPYGWSIWVCGDTPFILVLATSVGDKLTSKFGRFTPLHGWLLLRL